MSAVRIYTGVQNFNQNEIFGPMVSLRIPEIINRISEAVLSRLEGVSFSYGPSGTSQSLLNRAVFIGAVGFLLAAFYFRYKTNTQGLKQLLGSFLGYSSALIAAGMAGYHLITAYFALYWFIQLQSEALPSSLRHAYDVIYTPVKYSLMTMIGFSVFHACTQNILNGLLFYCMTSTLIQATDPVKIVQNDQNQTPEQMQASLGQLVGTYVCSSLFEIAMFGGIIGSVLLRNGPSWMSGVSGISEFQAENLNSFLYGLGGVSLGLFLLNFFDFGHLKYLNRLQQNSERFSQQFGAAAAQAQKLSQKTKKRLSEAHFYRSALVTLGLIEKKTHPEQREELINELKTIPMDEKLIYLLENLPFLEEQEKDDFLSIFHIETKDLFERLTLEQIYSIYFPPSLRTRLNPEGLAAIEAESNELEKTLDAVVSTYSKEQHKEIYEAIRDPHLKFIEYSLLIGRTVELLSREEFKKIEDEGAKKLFVPLIDCSFLITSLSEKLTTLASKIEESTGEMTQSAEEALGLKGLRLSDCEEILLSLQLPTSAEPYGDVARFLLERGVKNKYDLIQKNLLVLDDNVEQLKARLVEFLSSTKPSFSKLFLAGVDKVAKVTHQIYAFVAVPFFIALQLYLQPKMLVAGLICRFAISLIFSSDLNSQLFQRHAVVMLSTGVLTQNGHHFANRFKIMSLDQFTQSLLSLIFSTSFGAIPAFLWGTQIPLRTEKYVTSVRRIFQPV